MIALEFMIIACIMFLFSMPIKTFTTYEIILVLCFWIGGSFIFNSIIREATIHYKSYEYIFIIGSIYLIIQNDSNYVRHVSYIKSLISLITSFGIGYILVILLLPLFHLYQFVKVNHSIWLGEFLQSFVVSVLSFLLFKISLFILQHLTNWYKSRYLNRIKDLSSVPYRLYIFIIHTLVGTKNSLTIFIERFVKYFIVLLILMLFFGVHFEEPMSILKSNIKYQEYPWIMKIDSSTRGNVKLTSKLYTSDVYHYFNIIRLNSKSMRNDITINNTDNKLMGHLSGIKYKHLGQLKSFKLTFNGINNGAYYFNGDGYIWENSHISSKVHIKLCLRSETNCT